jgi:cell shape-determining protein MreC
MDIVLYCIVGFIAFIAGRTSAPKEIVTQIEMTDKEHKEYEYQLALNQSLLTEVQQYRALETKLRGELWETKKQLKTLQQKN